MPALSRAYASHIRDWLRKVTVWFREDWMLIDETRALIERDRNTLRRLMAAVEGMSIRVRDATRVVAESQELLDRIERRFGPTRGENGATDQQAIIGERGSAR
jgi:hypothetical protein